MNGITYRWKVEGEDGYIVVLLGPEKGKGQFARGGFSYFSIEIEWFNDQGKADCWSLAQRMVVTPHHIRKAVLRALERGWKPDTPGPIFPIGSLDDVEPLRLKPDLVFPALSGAEVVLTFAHTDRGQPLQPDLSPFTGMGKFYLVFPDQETAIEFARGKVQENPQVEAWIRREKNVADYYVSKMRERSFVGLEAK